MNTAQQKIKTLIYALLARREYSSSRLEQKLSAKGFQAKEISAVLEELRREGSVNDQRYVESYIRYRRSRGFGPLRIRQELQQEGMSKEMIEASLDIAHNEWLAEAKKAWRKRFRGKQPTGLKDRSQQLRFLQYRGFTSQQIDNIFDTNNDSDTHVQDTDSVPQEALEGFNE